MHLQRDLLAAKGGARADVHHAQSPRRLVAYLDPHGIDARGGHKTARVGELDVGRGETELAALLESGHHAAAHPIGIAQAARGRLHLARCHMAPTDGGTDVDALQFEDGVLHHLHPHLAAIGHIVGEALGAVVAEAVVVADEEFGHVEPPQQQVVHEVAGGELRQGHVEVAYANNYELSFPIIATINGQTLHNHDHSNLIKSGDMLLLDAGAETEMGYAGDMSSTIPADAKFTTRQREIYDIQVAAHEAAVAALRPGIPFVDVYELSCKVIMEGLKELGFVKGDPMEAVRAGAHAMFMPCGLGHMMGLDVHDMENLGEVYVGYDGQPKSTEFGRKSLRLGRKLEPGFVLTIEPGVYFIPELMDLWRSQNKFTEFINYDKLFTYKDFSGIRNEEDYLITENGARLLGKKIPVRAEEVEAIRK